MAYISRDPFARTELHRRVAQPLNASYYGVPRTCDWCGNQERKRLYVYRVESDSGRSSDIRGLFCSVGCMRSYHG